MKIQLRKHQRKEERKRKKQQKNKSFNKNLQNTDEYELDNEVYNEPIPIARKPRKIPEPDNKLLQIDQEIEQLEKKLGLRNEKSKTREKNWKKVIKHLEFDGLGADFYDLLEGKSHKEEDEVSIEAPPSPEIELVQPKRKKRGFDRDSDDNSEKSSDHNDDPVPLPKKKPKSHEISDPILPPAQISVDETKRKLKGLLNRLSDQNIEPITNQITELFRSTSVSSLNEAFWEFLLTSFANNKIPTQLLAVYACETSALSKLIGREVSAFQLSKLFSEKELLNSNQVSYLSYLFYFSVISSETISGFIRFFSADLQEKTVEFLIIMFNLIGFTFRKKDPGLFRELFTEVQTACKACEATSIRLKFMIDILTDIKNNKKQANVAEERLKFLRNYIKNTVSKSTGIKDSQINVGFKELETDNWRSLMVDTVKAKKRSERFAPEIEALARAQKMNTEARRKIFCTIMSSEDYMEAFAKLMNIKKGERDIVRVVMICCGQEEVYNKFYTLLASQLCKHKNSYKYSFQYALWDNLKQFADFSIRKISNMAKFFAGLIVDGAVGLSVIKAVDFDDVNEHLSVFLRILLETILTSTNIQTISLIFSKLGSNEKLKVFCEGLKVYMKIVLSAPPRQSILDSIGAESFKSRLSIARKSLIQSS